MSEEKKKPAKQPKRRQFPWDREPEVDKNGKEVPFKGRDRFPSHDELIIYDYIRTATAKNAWYYRDRCGVARGPAPLPTLKEAWVHGLIDQNTLVWGNGLVDFLPIKNVQTLVAQIRTPEVQVATWVKKQFVLKPALAEIRKKRASFRLRESQQVERMR